MGRSSKPPLSSDRAWSCVSLNFSISGLGTLKAGRVFSGTGQMLLNFLGLFFVGWWMWEWIRRIFEAQMGNAVLLNPEGWLWKCGAVSIGISWTWMLITCADLMRRARREEDQQAQNIPPRLADLPKNNPEKH